MAYNDFKRYIWLLAFLTNVGAASKREIADAWQDDPLLNPDGEPLPDRTFYNHLKAIKAIFGIDISRSKENDKFRITRKENVYQDNMYINLFNTVTFNTASDKYEPLRNRILFEEEPIIRPGSLSTILAAMKEGKKLEIKYRKFGEEETSGRIVSPYCIKYFKHRWYLLTKDEEGQWKTFALDPRMRKVSLTDQDFVFPADFDAEEHFATAIGIETGEGKDILLKAYGKEADYLRSAPIHASQRRIAEGEGYSLFCLTNVNETSHELLQELLSRGDRIEVLGPRSLRQTLAGEVEKMRRLYADPWETAAGGPLRGARDRIDGEMPAWDSTAAAEKAAKGSFAARAVRTEVYHNNNAIFAAGGYRAESGKVVTLPADELSLKETRVYSEEFRLTGFWPISAAGTETFVVNDDCFRVARKMQRKGLKPVVLNLADARTACGGYPRGARAQEESLCRSSTLSRSLYPFYSPELAKKAGVPFVRSAYPMDLRFGGIYSPDVTVFRDNAAGYPLLEDPYRVSVISVAALDFAHGIDLAYRAPDGGFTPEGESIMKDKIRTIFRIALLNGHYSVVLGAFGCGAFRLRPDLVAALFSDILLEEEFHGCFLQVCFALLEPGLTDPRESRFAPFYEYFSDDDCLLLQKEFKLIELK